MRIVFLGINPMGKRVYDWLIEQGEDVLCLMTEKKDLGKIAALKPDIIISAGFRHIVPAEILGVPRYGAINFHKSLLPLHRGANPVFWTLLEQTPCGISLHYMSPNLDDGDLIAQKEFSVDFSDTAKDLYEKLETEQVELFKSVWPEIKASKARRIPQPSGGSYRAKNDFKALRKLEPDKTMKVIDFIHYLRAMTFPPFKNAYLEIGGRKYYLELKINEESESTEEKTVPYIKQYGW